MAIHFSVLAWRIPGMGEPGGLPSMGLHRVRHHRSDLAAAAAERIHLSTSISISLMPKTVPEINNKHLLNKLIIFFLRQGR